MRDTNRPIAWPPRSGRARLRAAALVSGLLVAGCGGGSRSPSVAAVSSTTASTSSPRTATTSRSRAATASSSSASTATRPSKDPAVLLVEWARCMRSHGDPTQADPTITANKLIDIPWNPAIPGGYNGTNKGGQGNSGPGQYCRTYLAAAQTALQGGRTPKPPDPAALVNFSKCMRANGVPDFPDPNANGNLVLAGGPVTYANNPTFQNASKACTQKTGVRLPSPSSPPPGTITLSGAGALP
jgi:hypothetical protein